MSSRATILANIKKNQPRLIEHPGEYASEREGDLYPKFEQAIQMVGAECARMEDQENWSKWIKIRYGTAIRIYSEAEDIKGNFSVNSNTTIKDLNKIDLAILKGRFAVAENAAVWVDQFIHRSIPFIAQHLMLVINKSEIVANMHEAYARIEQYEAIPDFATFISGPSKTADIAQTLVYGAQGARSLMVIIK